MKKHFYDYLWVASALYLILGFFNILFAWLGLLCFMIPLLISIFGKSKAYCNRYCGRGQLFSLLGQTLRLSRNKPMPRFLKSRFFRYGFLVFFMTMFGLMIAQTVGVFLNADSLKTAVTLLWTFRVPWTFAYTETALPAWVSQFAFGFYSIMLTSTILGIVLMVLYKPRAWCVCCPMGTMTQLVCKAHAHGKTDQN